MEYIDCYSNLNKSLTHDQIHTIAHIKRFFELWYADYDFSKAVLADPSILKTIYKLDVDIEKIRPLWDHSFSVDPKIPFSTELSLFQDFTNKKVEFRQKVKKGCTPQNFQFKQWRQRQISRCIIQIGAHINEYLIHTPVIFELAVGCSVGCDFCAFKAEPLQEIFYYTKENARLWQDILTITKEMVGDSMQWGTCYFATEPLDNPDYEKFCLDFYQVTGEFPQTTTAAAMRDPQRTKRLLQLAKAKGSRVDRFSVLSRGILNRVFDFFTPEELIDVELLLLFKDSENTKSLAGRFRDKIKNDPSLLEKEKEKVLHKIEHNRGKALDSSEKADVIQTIQLPETICCLSGFMVNMVKKTVQLISPCIADDKWDKGFIIYDEGTFTDAESYRELLGKMIKNMTSELTETDIVHFNDELHFEINDNGFVLTSPKTKLTYSNEKYNNIIKSLGTYLHKGDKSVGELSTLMFYQHGIAAENVRATIKKFINQGILSLRRSN